MPIPEVLLGDGNTLRPRTDGPQTFSVLMEDGCYTARFVPAIDSPISAYSRDDLASAVQDVLAALWRQYADAPDDTLWPKAQDLKRRLRDRYEVVC